MLSLKTFHLSIVEGAGQNKVFKISNQFWYKGVNNPQKKRDKKNVAKNIFPHSRTSFKIRLILYKISHSARIFYARESADHTYLGTTPEIGYQG